MAQASKATVLKTDQLEGFLEQGIGHLTGEIERRMEKHGRRSDLLPAAMGVVTDFRRAVQRRIRALQGDINTRDQQAEFCGTIETLAEDARTRMFRISDRRMAVVTEMGDAFRTELESIRAQVTERFELPAAEVKADPASKKYDVKLSKAASSLDISHQALLGKVSNHFTVRMGAYVPGLLEFLKEETLLGSELSSQVFYALADLTRDLYGKLINIAGQFQATHNFQFVREYYLKVLSLEAHQRYTRTLDPSVVAAIDNWLLRPMRLEVEQSEDITALMAEQKHSMRVNHEALYDVLRPREARQSTPYSLAEKKRLLVLVETMGTADLDRITKELNREFHGGARFRQPQDLATYLRDHEDELIMASEPAYSIEEDGFLEESLRAMFGTPGQDAATCEAFLNSEESKAQLEQWAAFLNKAHHGNKNVRRATSVRNRCKQEIVYIIYGDDPFEHKEAPAQQVDTHPELGARIDVLVPKVKGMLALREPTRNEHAIRKILKGFVEFFERYRNTASHDQLSVYLNLLEGLVEQEYVTASAAGSVELRVEPSVLATVLMDAVQDLAVKAAESREMAPILDCLSVMERTVQGLQDRLDTLEQEGWADRDGQLNREIETIGGAVRAQNEHVESLRAALQEIAGRLATTNVMEAQWDALVNEVRQMKTEKIPGAEQHLSSLRRRLEELRAEKHELEARITEILEIEEARDALKGKRDALVTGLLGAFETWKQAYPQTK